MTAPTTSHVKPTIVIVPGSFSPPSLYRSIVDDLESAGYEATTIYLPTVGDANKTVGVTLADDATAIKSVLTRLIDEEGKDVILVTHSYGGIAGAEGAKGFAQAVRQADQKKGGIIHMVYATALIAREGESLLDTMRDCPTLDNVIDHVSNLSVLLHTSDHAYVVSQDGHMTLKPIPSAQSLFTQLPQEEGVQWVGEMPGHSRISFDNLATYPAYKDIPMTYLLCENDLIISPDVQRSMVRMVEKETGKKVEVYSLSAGHMPNITASKDVVKVIRIASGASV